MRSGSEESPSLFKSEDLLLSHPHVSIGGHVVCTNSKCKTRIMKSNAHIGSLTKALLFTNNAKIFIVDGSVVAECICGSKYDMKDMIQNRGIYFEKNKVS